MCFFTENVFTGMKYLQNLIAQMAEGHISKSKRGMGVSLIDATPNIGKWSILFLSLSPGSPADPEMSLTSFDSNDLPHGVFALSSSDQIRSKRHN